jgi:ABC-type sulfate/molybdate transport systems ATPase subunit
VPKFKHMWAGGEDAEAVVVPTAGIVQLQHCIGLLHKQGHPVMVMGSVGAGKTALMRSYMAGLQAVKRVCITMNEVTDSEMLQVREAML